jgi:hypothetical protein
MKVVRIQVITSFDVDGKCLRGNLQECIFLDTSYSFLSLKITIHSLQLEMVEGILPFQFSEIYICRMLHVVPGHKWSWHL